MNPTPDPKILAIGKGSRDQEWFRILSESGYEGPIGILGHQSDRDARRCLEENLAGFREQDFCFNQDNPRASSD